jgi:hypothetical protein
MKYTSCTHRAHNIYSQERVFGAPLQYIGLAFQWVYGLLSLGAEEYHLLAA